MILSGPELDEVVRQAKEWYLEMREYLLKQLEAGPYPYGNIRLSRAEQYSRYREMTPQDWSQLYVTLQNKYAGHPNSRELVGNEIMRYRQRMETVGRELADQGLQTETPLWP